MSFAAPLGLLATLLAIPLVLLYLLRPRRPRVDVASTYLWSRTPRAVSAAVPWQRFAGDRSFWLLLAALLLAALALARPSVPVAAELGDHTIIVVDASASMLADEDGPTRAELARREVDELIAGLAPGQIVSVIEAAGRARVALSASADAAAVRRAVEAIEPTQGRADLRDAFLLATALQRPGQRTIVQVVTDSRPPDAAMAAAPADLRVRTVGSDRPNLAVTRLQTVPTGAGDAQVFAQVRNFGALSTDARVTFSVGDEEVTSQQVTLAPRATTEIIVPLTLAGGSADGTAIVRARVEPVGVDAIGEQAGDALAIDDTAFSVAMGPRDLTALVAGPGNVFVEAALASVPGVEVRTAPAVPADLTDVDLLVVDRTAAPETTRVPSLYIAPTDVPEALRQGAQIELPAVTFQDPDHEVLADVELSDLAIAEARPLDSAELRAVVGGPDGALVLAGRLEGQPVIAVGFDLHASNLPLQVAWPVFVANTVSWLAGTHATAPAIAGDEHAFALPPGVEGVEVRPPAGAPRLVGSFTPRVTLDQVGVWHAAWRGPEEVVGPLAAPLPIAVNADGEEGDLLRDRAVARRAPAPTGADADVVMTGRRVYGPGILVAVLVLAMVEWILAARPPRAGDTAGGNAKPLRRLRGMRRARSRSAA